jgi:hypothetical protein
MQWQGEDQYLKNGFTISCIDLKMSLITKNKFKFILFKFYMDEEKIERTFNRS